MRKRIVVPVVLAFILAASANAQTTDFFELVETGTPRQIREAISNGADLNARKDDETDLMLAAQFNKDPEVFTTLLEAGADINAKSEGGYTALMFAAIWNRSEVITILLAAGAEVNVKDDFFGETPLMWAAKINRDPEVISVLLNAGADAKAKDNSGKTALDSAQKNEKLKDTDAFRQLQEASQ